VYQGLIICSEHSVFGVLVDKYTISGFLFGRSRAFGSVGRLAMADAQQEESFSTFLTLYFILLR